MRCRLFKRWSGGLGLVVMALFLSTGNLHAAGFALMEQSVKGLGSAFAGGAAAAEDASTLFYNPAGMVLLKGQQAAVGLHIIKTSFRFTNEGSTHVLTPLTGEGLTGNNGGDAGTWNAVPNAYYTANLGNGWAVGLGIDVPFGLTTDYDAGWVGRYHALKSSIITTNINPSVAYAVTDKLSLGLGLDAMYMDGEFSSAIDFGTILAAAGGTPQRDDGRLVLNANDWGYGHNAGLLYQFTSDTRIGLTYRSKVKQKLNGSATFTVPAKIQAILAALGSGAFVNGQAGADVTLPDMASLALYQRVSPQLALLADIGWTHWATLQELRIQFANSEQPDAVTTLSWKNAWQFAVGAVYTVKPQWDLRCGARYDQTPIPDAEHRTPRLPDQDRLWTSVGTSYRFTEALAADLSYTHLFMLGGSNVDMEPTGENATRGGLKGSFDNEGNITSVQVSYAW
jgi:long-chain fatty acid transport protein